MKLVIANTDIHQDAEGRFSLNDLHAASGGNTIHRPGEFLRLQQTQELIAEIDAEGDAGKPASVATKKGGHNQGSYGVKELVYAYAMWISPKFHLQVIRTFDEVVTGKVAATRPATLSRNQVAAGILLLRSAAEDLKFAPSAVLGGYQRLEERLGVAGLLPAYAVDAPSTATAGSSEVTKAVGELLEQFGVGMSAVAFNRLLLQHGFLEEHERPSSHGVKKFKVVTDMEYGKNLTSPSNPRETQPHWYVSKFPELLELVMPAKPAAVG